MTKTNLIVNITHYKESEFPQKVFQIKLLYHSCSELFFSLSQNIMSHQGFSQKGVQPSYGRPLLE